MNQQDTTDVFSKTTPSPKRTLPGLFSDKKRMAIATATVLAGGTALAWGLSAKGGPSPTPGPGAADPSAPGGVLSNGQTWPVQGGTITPTDDVQIGLVGDNLSFDEAFQAARTQTGPGGIFVWHGQVYNTYQKEEWTGLALAQRQEFLTDVGFKPAPPASAENSAQEPELSQTPEPIFIDTLMGGNRVIGCDSDRDGMIDMVVMPTANGQEVRIIDADGDDGLDRVITIDVYTDEVVNYTKLDEPWFLPNSDFKEGVNRYNDSLDLSSTRDVAAHEQPEVTYTAASDDLDLDETEDDDAAPDYQNDANNEL